MIVFEDFNYSYRNPLNLLRPSGNLPIGLFSLKERIEYFFGTIEKTLSYWDEEKEKYSGWFINGSFLWQERVELDKNTVYLFQDIPLLFYEENLPKEVFFSKEELLKKLSSKRKREIKGIYFYYIFDFIKKQPEILAQDIEKKEKNSLIPEGVIVIGNKKDIHIEEEALVFPGTILDARGGGIYISKKAQIISPTLIQGPCFIGKEVLIDAAKIREGCSFFTGCKISGEVEKSIFCEYTNKHHDGFIGHSFVGRFVNFGAMATNSDLKNNYSSIRVWLNNQFIDSQTNKLGVFIGDHTKLGIGSLLNSGTIIGCGANLFMEKGFYPKYVPPFAWGSSYPFQKYRLSEFLLNTDKIMQRRKQTLSEEEKNRIIKIYNKIKEECYATFS